MSKKLEEPVLVVYTGPMFSSKTTYLLLSAEREKHAGKKLLCYKPQIDQRYHESKITTHMGWSLPSMSVSTGAEMLAHATQHTPSQDYAIFVDETFMIDGSAEAIITLHASGYSVYVASIQLSSSRESFAEVEKLLPFATKIDVKSSTCAICGDDAYYTYRKIKSSDTISVGGANEYEPRCWHHMENSHND